MLYFILNFSPLDGTVLVSASSTQASKGSDSLYLSPSPTLRDSSGAEIVSPSSLVHDGLDESGVAFLKGDEFISCVTFVFSSITTDAVSWVFDLIAGVQGPSTSHPFALGSGVIYSLAL
ncbi:hypothetical protein Peur_023903 [Populus x canadensis]